MLPASGERHELHPTKQINVLGKSISTPSIVVHIAEDDGSQDSPNFKKIKQTRCPDRQSSLD